MYIAICDDCAAARSHTADLIGQFAAAHNLQLRTRQFADPKEMLRASHTEHFTHYFLDIVMPGTDGIAVAGEIRAVNADAKLVFITSFKEFAYQSYRLHACDYLLKPMDGERMNELLSRLLAQEQESVSGICVENGRNVFRISFARLSHLEVNRKKLYFHTVDQQVRQIYGTLSEYAGQLLVRDEFIKVHRSYIVNMNQIAELSPEGCVMFSGKVLPISRLLFHEVRSKYIAHLFGREEA